MTGELCALPDVDWQPAYSHEDGNLVKMFFTPALARAGLYQRVTGYFSAGALVLAARGLDALISNGGKMQMIVGCTLGPDEVRQIDEGYKLRELLGSSLAEKIGLCVEKAEDRERIGWLSWMVANGHLDIKLAVPKDENGKLRSGVGIYHAKAGILTDLQDNRLAFTGSINETEAGWTCNWESFNVSCSWRGEWDLKRVEKVLYDFNLLWNNAAKTAEVIEFPDALRRELLRHLPPNGCPAKPPEADPPVSLEEVPPEPEVIEEGEDDGLLPEERRRKIWAFIKKAPARPDGALVGIRTSTVSPWPHQLRVYKRMLDEWPFRLLIADEVGLGKTIEAGMIIRHVWISGLARRICIMVPSGVARQWQSELYEKFNLLVPIYTGKSFLWPEYHFRQHPLEEKVGRDDWTRQPMVIVSSHLMRRADRQHEIVDADNWDLLVLDEAHHARRMGAGTSQEKGPNRLLKLMKKLESKTASLLLLSATPMQVHPVEIWDLLKLLDLPPEWTDQAFVRYFEALGGNPDDAELHRLARMFQASENTFGPLPDSDVKRIAKPFNLKDIKIRSMMKALREPKSIIPIRRLNVDQRKAALAVLKAGSPIRYRMSRHTRDLLREYYRKGLLDSTVATRNVSDISVKLTPVERALYDAVEDYIGTTYQMADPGAKNAVGFIMTVYRRRVASCFYALRRTLEKRLEVLDAPHELIEEPERLEEDLPQNEQADEVLSGDDAAVLERESLVAEEKDSIRRLFNHISGLETDSKALRLVEELQAAFSSQYDSAIVFTQYTDTMDFLRDFLTDRLKLPIGCFSGAGGMRLDSSGAWQACSKEQIKRFLRQGDIRLLICTDAAGEGLNLQYCGVLVNYDLPWNPMKVEQRIGRIDRIGQKHSEIRIINMAYADTVEADVYFALSDRIGLFNGVVGKLQPILSMIPKEFENAVLVPAEQRDRARYEAVSAVEMLVKESAAGGFDIDDVSGYDLDVPQFPDPPYQPSDLDEVLINEDLLPPGIECEPKDPYTYSLRIPGNAEPARITTNPAVFDEHFENHQLFLPGSPLFDEVYARSGADEETEGLDLASGIKTLL